MRNGILVGGNWIIDRVKIIDKYPEEESLANIITEYSSNGGSAYNILKDLVKMHAPMPLEAVGLVGDDVLGDQIIKDCREQGINTTYLHKTSLSNTSYTDVMSVQNTGKRTFFHHRGANALLDTEHFNFGGSGCKIFHLGYLLLLDKLDKLLEDGRSVASFLLEDAVIQGFITTVDLVSESDPQRFKKIIPPSLPFVDYLFINEYEAGMLSSSNLVDENGQIIVSKCFDAAQQILDMGVRQWVILHFPVGVIALSKESYRLYQPCIALPPEKIAGSVGAGDAFASGVLMGIHEEWDMRESLQLGVSVAASSLLAATCSDGVLPCNECLALADKYGYREYDVVNTLSI
ncbi:MAG TPA: carbohydrate kinase family protein [Sphingobacteriaceae bacterium]